MLRRLNPFSSAGSRAKPARFGEDPTKLPALLVAAGIAVVLVAGVAMILRGLL